MFPRVAPGRDAMSVSKNDRSILPVSVLPDQFGATNAWREPVDFPSPLARNDQHEPVDFRAAVPLVVQVRQVTLLSGLAMVRPVSHARYYTTQRSQDGGI